MIEASDIIGTTSVYLAENQVVISLIILLVSGEVGSHILGTLAGREDISLMVVLLVTPLFLMTIDILFYGIAQKLQGVFAKSIKVSQGNLTVQKIQKHFASMKIEFLEKPVTTLLLIKLLPASKVLIIPYVLFYKMPLRRFIYLDAVVTIPLSILLIGTGWLVGVGLFGGSGTEGFIFLLTYIIILLILINLFGEKIGRKAVMFFEKLLKRETDKKRP